MRVLNFSFDNPGSTVCTWVQVPCSAIRYSVTKSQQLCPKNHVILSKTRLKTSVLVNLVKKKYLLWRTERLIYVNFNMFLTGTGTDYLLIAFQKQSWELWEWIILVALKWCSDQSKLSLKYRYQCYKEFSLDTILNWHIEVPFRKVQV